MEKIAVSAMKQSMKAWLPEIREMIPFQQFVKFPFDGLKCIAHCIPGDKPSLKSLVEPGVPVLILIGPEGDFSPEEVELARTNGFREVSLGKARLRTETAALAACLTVSLANE
jgi:16S rRNA (uracil1498-N3)-methyltransferase